MSHTPVLINEILQYLAPSDGDVYLDCTFGAGGYSKALLQAADCHVFAMDRDLSTSVYAEEVAKKFHGRFSMHFADFGSMAAMVQTLPQQKFNAIIFDLGVSSMQIDNPERGFSFMKDAQLDMRMDQQQELTAAFIVNHYSQEQLCQIIKDYGGERKAKVIAQAIVAQRQNTTLASTLHLAQIIKEAVGHYKDKINPATRTFQALRIIVNQELTQLQIGLETAIKLLKIDGKLVVVSFHSGEAEIVKNFFNTIISKSKKHNKYKEFSHIKIEEKNANFELITKKAIIPSALEVKLNPRARSAQLKVIKKNGDDN